MYPDWRGARGPGLEALGQKKHAPGRCGNRQSRSDFPMVGMVRCAVPLRPLPPPPVATSLFPRDA